MRAGLFISFSCSSALTRSTASDVSRLLGMDKVIAYRLLRTLAAEDFLVQDASTKKYRLGPDLIELASDNLRQVPAGEVVRPWMESLRYLSDETVMFVVRRGTETFVSLHLDRHRLDQGGPG